MKAVIRLTVCFAALALFLMLFCAVVWTGLNFVNWQWLPIPVGVIVRFSAVLAAVVTLWRRKALLS